jgi:hypothetical protein
MTVTPVRSSHPVWCDTRYCTGNGEHFSEGFTLDGEVPIVVEVFQGIDDATPLLSILRRGAIASVIAMPLLAAGPLADVLQHIVTGVHAGSRLDPPGTGRGAPDDPRDYEVFVSGPPSPERANIFLRTEDSKP